MGSWTLGFTFSEADANKRLLSVDRSRAAEAGVAAGVGGVREGHGGGRGRGGGEKEGGVGASVTDARRPYLSEAWEVAGVDTRPAPYLSQAGKVVGLEERCGKDVAFAHDELLGNGRLPTPGEGVDMKGNLRCWAQAVASAVRCSYTSDQTQRSSGYQIVLHPSGAASGGGRKFQILRRPPIPVAGVRSAPYSGNEAEEIRWWQPEPPPPTPRLIPRRDWHTTMTWASPSPRRMPTSGCCPSIVPRLTSYTLQSLLHSSIVRTHVPIPIHTCREASGPLATHSRPEHPLKNFKKLGSQWNANCSPPPSLGRSSHLYPHRVPPSWAAGHLPTIAMADQKLVASFDALWFFSNLLSPRSSPPTYPRTNPPPPPPHPKEPAEPHVQTPPVVRDPAAEAATASSIPIPATAAAPEEAPGMPRLDQRRTIERRSAWRRGGLCGCGEAESSFDEEEIIDLGRRLRVEAWRWGSVLPSVVDSSLQRTVRVYGLAASGRKSSVSCSTDRRGGDDMAVRELLRSWAHAVACTVR